MADSISDAVEKLWLKYKDFVSINPDTTGQVEAACRVLSYFIAGRFNDSQVLAELVYSSSNLLVMFNDIILQKAAQFIPKVPLTQMKLMRLITMVEYLEVFVEMASLKLWGNTGRWILIATVQIFKAALRLFLLVEHNAGIQPLPPLSPFNREILKDRNNLNSNMTEEDQQSTSQPVLFTLKRSGKSVRSLSAAPPIGIRDWNLKKVPSEEKEQKKTIQVNYEPSALNRQRTWAEGVHIVRPIAHLFAMLCCGEESWKPWVLSCGMDISSLVMMGDPVDLNPRERSELKRRTLILLFYLMRSPFFDRFTQARLIILLNALSSQVPGSKFIIKPLLDYLPVWQKIYFYVWGT